MFFILTFLSTLYSACAQENTTPSEKKPYDIAVVNIDKLLYECKAAKQVQEQLEAQRLKFQEEMKAQEEYFLRWDKKLAEQQKQMTSDAFSAKRKEFEEKLTLVHQKASQRREQLETTVNQAMGTIQEAILLLIRDAALQNHYKLVVPRNFIVFREEGLEITDELLKKLDEKLPSLTLTLPQP